ncbi:MAG: ABC transporter ATP-binding protein, partial [Burkholderiales bacterium]|nr:ABC transporter ATP-binding protein [Burkholderiales bacterium]
ESVLRRLSMWDKRDAQIRELSGGMKRRVLIAKALSHEPKILFLDEPTAGVDVDMRKETWKVIRDLKQQGVTIVLTTHYIEEAEEIADRIAIIDSGNILLVEGKDKLMQRLGTKKIFIELEEAISKLPTNLNAFDIKIESAGRNLIYAYDAELDKSGVTSVLRNLLTSGVRIKDIRTYQSSLEDIFVKLIQEGKDS